MTTQPVVDLFLLLDWRFVNRESFDGIFITLLFLSAAMREQGGYRRGDYIPIIVILVGAVVGILGGATPQGLFVYICAVLAFKYFTDKGQGHGRVGLYFVLPIFMVSLIAAVSYGLAR